MSETSEPKLLPCEHCNEKLQCIRKDDGYYYRIVCSDCGIKTSLHMTIEEAIAAWNRRVAEKPKWTKEPPTEEGWYCLFNHWASSMMQSAWVFKREEKLWVKINSQLYSMRDFCKAYPNASWLKIDIPAPPEKGENNDE